MLKLYFNEKAMEALAKEIRRASWGVSVAASTYGFKYNHGAVVLIGGAAWFVLQAFAVILESIRKDAEKGTK